MAMQEFLLLSSDIIRNLPHVIDNKRRYFAGRFPLQALQWETMLFPVLFFLAATPIPAGPPPASSVILSRISEEADAFQQSIVKTLTEETLDQRAVMGPSRFRPRIGKGATEAPKQRVQVRQIVSEYSVGTFQETGSADLHEFRQVVSVDGRAVQSAENARHALALGMRSQDDRIRKRMLEDFAKHGLVDIASDYGLILLEFTRRGLDKLTVTPGPESRIGAETTVALNWKQSSAEAGQLSFSGRRTVREPLSGTLWVRKSDGLPLRVEAWAEYAEAEHTIRDQASVEYTMSQHGFLTPVSVLHRHLIDGKLITENVYRYQPFKMFSSSAEIKFTEAPEPTPAPTKK